MSNAVDSMEKALAEITKDINFMLDDVFMIKHFEALAKKIKLFKEYLTYMFE